MDQLRTLMVKTQIQDRGVSDQRVLNAMRSVKRHEFVPGMPVNEAYADHPLPIGNGQTISQPYIVALMTELCQLRGTEKVLEIGTGSGYQAAVLSLLAREVHSIELVESLGIAAKTRLGRLGYANVTVYIGDGYQGLPKQAPFDVIILTAAPPVVPKNLIDQLAEGGILVAPEGEFMQELLRMRKTHGQVSRETITYVRFVPMIQGPEGLSTPPRNTKE